VAHLAVRRETRGPMRRVRRRLIILQVAPLASRRRARKPSIDVARVASDRNVRAVERKIPKPSVVEPNVQPAARVHRMALRAIERKTRRVVRRVLRV